MNSLAEDPASLRGLSACIWGCTKMEIAIPKPWLYNLVSILNKILGCTFNK